MRSATLSAPACGWVRGGIVKRGTRHVGRWRCDPGPRERGGTRDTLPSALADPACAAHRADDAAIMADSADDLAAALAAVDDSCDASCLALNAAKCKVMVLHGAAPAADGVSPHAAAARVDCACAAAPSRRPTRSPTSASPSSRATSRRPRKPSWTAPWRAAGGHWTWGHVLRDPGCTSPSACSSPSRAAGRRTLRPGPGGRARGAHPGRLRHVHARRLRAVQPPAHRHNLAYPAMLQELGLPCAMALTRGGAPRAC